MKKRFWIAVAALLLALCLTGCGIRFLDGVSKYVSSYSATMLVRSETSRSASLNFSTLKGRIVYELRSGGSDAIAASAKLGEGIATVWYDADGTKTEWFTVTAGEDVEVSTAPLEKGTVYVIIETDGKCRDSSFRFDVRDAAE